MTKILDEVLAANAKYAENFGDKGSLPLPPRHFAILTCMDARLDPAKYAGLAEGDAHVIRNAGGRASDDAIRSLEKSLGEDTIRPFQCRCRSCRKYGRCCLPWANVQIGH
jgi:carbonic anhydrase